MPASIASMETNSPIRIGSRVYIRNCVAGEPGCVVAFSRGKAVVEWYDLDLGRPTEHDPASLVLDESFRVMQLGLDFESQAA